jgi:hypothetical protein
MPLGMSMKPKGLDWGVVSASKIPVPRSNVDRFDD